MADEKNLAPYENQGDIVIYQTEDGGTKIDVRFVDEGLRCDGYLCLRK